MAHYDKSDIVTRNPQVAYLSSSNHFIVKIGQNRFGKRRFLKFQAIIADEMTVSQWKRFTIFLFIVRTGLKSAGLKCGVRKPTS